MSKKDFELIARVLREVLAARRDDDAAVKAVTETAQHFALNLRVTNERFDSAKFLKACGVNA